MKKSKRLVILLALLLLCPLSSSALPSSFWPHWGRHNRGSHQFSQQHHSVRPKASHPKALENCKRAGPHI